MHAARIVLPRLPHELRQAGLGELWTAFCAAYVVIGAPALTELEAVRQQEDWQSLFSLAIASNDDHDIKLTHTCHEENRVAPSPLYFAAARRRLTARRNHVA